jgi:integrase
MAIQRDYLTVNPASKVTLPNPENERDRILSEDEWSRLYAEAGDTLQPILLMAYRLGLRFGEIVNLTWDRVDRERGLITLRAIDTKTKQPRRVPLTADLLATLRELYKVRYLGQDRCSSQPGSPSPQSGRPLRTPKSEQASETFGSTISGTVPRQR